jgi:DNA-binding NarL/FixJ family response regulator
MPGRGVSAAAAITSRLPGTAVVMLTVSRDDDDLFAALRAGAVGYLLKDIPPERLPEALRAVLRGEAAMPRALVARLMDEFRSRGSRRVTALGGRPVQLTAREWEVLDGMREGLSTAELADRLHVAPVTIRTHVASILRKLRVPDRAAAVRLVQDS